MNILVNKPNRILQRQKEFQAYNGKVPVYWRGTRSKVYIGLYSALLSVSLVGSMYTLAQYANGTVKKNGDPE